MRTLRLFVAVLAVATAACGDSGPESAPGTLTATLVSPNGAEGSALFSLVGPGINGVRPVEGWAFAESTGDTTRVVVVGDQDGVLRFQVELADTTRKPVTSVLQVAGPDDALRAALTAYEVEIR